MATKNICFVTFSLLMMLVSKISAYDDIISDLVKHIQRLDAKITQIEGTHRDETDAKLVNLEEKFREEINAKIVDLESKHRDEIENLRQQMKLREIECDKKMVESDEKSTTDEENTSHTRTNRPIHKRGLLDGVNVAFSAYMDHDTNKMGPGQTLIYNQVLLNDGGGYNKHTGIFTAPMGGVYSFSFFIGERDLSNEWVALWVNSENKIEAAVDTWHSAQDLQGGNTVNLKLATGDVVYVKNLGDGHVEGSRTNRLTSFSGFLIYPVEGPTTVVGK